VCGSGSLACSSSSKEAPKHEVEFVNWIAPERMFGVGNGYYTERMFAPAFLRAPTVPRLQ
jgi:hypothetical protein